MKTIVEKTEAYINKYVTLPDKYYSLPVALWAIATHTYMTFDAFPYLTVCGVTKRSGKSRLGIDVMQQIAQNAQPFSCKSAASVFRQISDNHPTCLFDEAEVLSSEEAGEMREVLNKGYRRGGTHTKFIGGEVKTFETYCPKAFVLIGDVNDTLKDRSIVVWMRRAEPANRFVYQIAQPEGETLQAEIKTALKEYESEILTNYLEYMEKGLQFITDRDEEIWVPLFAVCKAIAPHRLQELTMAAVDLCSEKTADIRRFDSLREKEKIAQQLEYAERLVNDLLIVCNGEKGVATAKAIEQLYSIPTAPWRKFKGVGLSAIEMADLVALYGLKPKNIRFSNSNRKQSKGGVIAKGYAKEDIKSAIKKAGEKIDNRFV